MSSRNEVTLKEAITAMLKAYGLEEKQKEFQLIDGWEKIVGKMIANHTKDIFLHKKKLYVRMDSPALREELSYARSKILKKLQEEVGADFVSDLILK